MTVKIQFNPNMGPPGNFVQKELTPSPPPPKNVGKNLSYPPPWIIVSLMIEPIL